MMSKCGKNTNKAMAECVSDVHFDTIFLLPSPCPPPLSGSRTIFCGGKTPKIPGAFHSTKNSEISGPTLNGTVKKVFENLGIRFECTLFDGISGIIENFVFHSFCTEHRQSYDTVPCLPHSKGTAVFVFLAKLRAAQMNCQLDSA